MYKIILLLSSILLSGCFSAPDERYTYLTATDAQSGDTQTLDVDILLPPTGSDTLPNGKRGAIVFIHGGAWDSGSTNQVATFADTAREMGFFTMAMDYRLTSVRVEGRGERGVLYPWPTQAQDVRCALGWLAENADTYNVDVDAIALIGESSGGQMAFMVAENDYLTDECPYQGDVDIALAVSRSGPTDIEHWYNLGGFTNTWVQDLLNKDNPTVDELRSISPVFNIGDDSTTSILQQHGGKDSIVKEEVVLSYPDALDALGRQNEYLHYPDTGHTLDTSRQDALDWINTQLKGYTE